MNLFKIKILIDGFIKKIQMIGRQQTENPLIKKKKLVNFLGFLN
tara:strand:+ start:1115 stop:1246 length:132 start_codon:yes stop_codon:yes gene_type:complete